jgi:PHD/YefM family antitoxin component YafN of YafNO toxin-antitoxin module
MQVATLSDFRQNMKVMMDVAANKYEIAVIVHRGHTPSVMVSLNDYNRMCQLRSVNASKSKKQSPLIST